MYKEYMLEPEGLNPFNGTWNETKLSEEITMRLSDKDKMLIEKAKLHIRTHTATDVEKLLIKVIDEKIQAWSYHRIEEYTDIEGLEKFNELSKCLVECTKYLQMRNNNVYDAMSTVHYYCDTVIWDKTKDIGLKKSLKDVLMAVCEQMEFDEEYSIDDIRTMIENFFYETTALSKYLNMFINLEFLERVSPGVYKRVK